MANVFFTEELRQIVDVIYRSGEKDLDLGIILTVNLGPQVSLERLQEALLRCDNLQVVLKLENNKLHLLETDGILIATLDVT